MSTVRSLVSTDTSGRAHSLAGTSPELVVTKDKEPRLLVWLGLVLVASGLFHVGVWALEGFPSLQGPVTWRKPIVFGLSSGITTLSIAWVASLLPASSARRKATWTYAVTMALEIFLIDLQQWRGVASHFNVSTLLDNVLFIVSGVLILIAVGAVMVLARLLLRAPGVDVDTRRAALFGIGLLLVGSAIGIGMVVHGNVVLALGQGTPAVVGGKGLLKVSHGIALHALQTLPFLAWLHARLGVAVAVRARSVGVAALAHGILVFAALLQALLGRPPADVSLGVLALGFSAALLFLVAVVFPVAFRLGRPNSHVRDLVVRS